MAETEQEFLKIAQEVHKVNNEETVKEYYPNALRELNNLVALGEAIILNPKDYAIILNEELNKISEEIAKITDLEEQNELRKLLVFNSFNCVCGQIDHKLVHQAFLGSRAIELAACFYMQFVDFARRQITQHGVQINFTFGAGCSFIAFGKL